MDPWVCGWVDGYGMDGCVDPRYARESITVIDKDSAMCDDENAILKVQNKMEKFLNKFELYKFYINEYGEKLYIGLFFVPK
jgi:hypothetical protein